MLHKEKKGPHLNFEEENSSMTDILLKKQGYSQKASSEILKWYGSSQRRSKEETHSE